jgi:hypothetical protein
VPTASLRSKSRTADSSSKKRKEKKRKEKKRKEKKGCSRQHLPEVANLFFYRWKACYAAACTKLKISYI